MLQADFFLLGKQSLQPEKQGDRPEPAIRRSERHETFSRSGARIEPFGLNNTISGGLSYLHIKSHCFRRGRAIGPDRIFLGVHLVVIQKQVDGLGNFHASPPIFDVISLMLIGRTYHNFLSKLDKFLSWQDTRYSPLDKIIISLPVYRG